MPEYLAPGVFLEEVSFRAKAIPGVPTSTTSRTESDARGIRVKLPAEELEKPEIERR